ncbi:diamine oxidase [copper-containing]-like [Babylonia areolata]|uniref:diamine oxidase [copper-containing]-like n=1 Tax=Babylonia areolata TaxID=304850 RepID=UPI003FD38156
MAAHKPCSIEVSSYHPHPHRSRACCSPLLILLIVLTALLIVALIVALAVVLALRFAPPHCEPGKSSRVRDLEKPGLFNDLSPREMRAVRDFLLGDDKLGLTPVEEASLNSSYIFMIDLQVPLKSAVLGFTDAGRRKPGRAAIAVLYRGDKDPPRVEEHIVGPLPTPNYHRALTNPAYRHTPVPFASRPVDRVERRELRAFLKRVTAQLHELLQESFQMSYHDCSQGPDCMMLVDLPPRGQQSGERKSWFWGYRQVEGAPLHPLGFALQVDHLSNDVTRWRVTRVVYNGQMFYEVEDLMDRYREESLRKVRLSMDAYDRGFSSYERRGPNRFDAEGRGPRFVEPDGRRFTVDGQFVQYFGWSFNFRSRTTTGLQLFDVNFQDGRIAYEIGLQELAVFYSGHSPEISSLAFYGSSWLLGASSHELLPGVDCPSTAHFLDSFHFVDTPSPRRYRRSICIFELNEGIPLRRHYTTGPDGDGFRYYGGVVATSLVLRSIAVLWNKDYVFDYVFHLDGTMEARVSVTGYLQTTFSLPRERPFGHHVHEDLIGNAHQELFHFKVDVDVAGSGNRYETISLHAQDGPNFWFPSLNTTQMRYRGTVVQTERDSVWRHGSSPLLHHVFYNHKLSNRYRTRRGYRLVHKSPTDFVLKDARVARAAGWARTPMVVTKYKDVEDASSSLYAQGDPWDPVLDFSMFLEDNNTIVDQDLVAWVTLGATVVPSAEDVPSPTTTLNSYRFLLAPYNYFNVGPSTVVSDAVHITRVGEGGGKGEGEGGMRVDTFGTSREQPNCFQQGLGISEFSGKVETVET